MTGTATGWEFVSFCLGQLASSGWGKLDSKGLGQLATSGWGKLATSGGGQLAMYYGMWVALTDFSDLNATLLDFIVTVTCFL